MIKGYILIVDINTISDGIAYIKKLRIHNIYLGKIVFGEDRAIKEHENIIARFEKERKAVQENTSVVSKSSNNHVEHIDATVGYWKNNPDKIRNAEGKPLIHPKVLAVDVYILSQNSAKELITALEPGTKNFVLPHLTGINTANESISFSEIGTFT